MITSTAYMTASRTGIIKLYNDVPWATASWNIDAYYSTVFTRYDKYPITTSGTGVLSDGGKTITIEIEQPPRELVLNVGSFNKIFSFEAEDYHSNKELVYFNSAYIRGTAPTTSKGFALFNTSELSMNEKIMGGYRASLIIGEQVMGYAFGEYSPSVDLGNGIWGFGSILFVRVLWVNKPPASTVKFMVSLGDGSVYSTDVFWDGTDFTGPTSQRFIVEPTDGFGYIRLSVYESTRR